MKAFSAIVLTVLAACLSTTNGFVAQAPSSSVSLALASSGAVVDAPRVGFRSKVKNAVKGLFKKSPSVAIPYDAAARLAYEASDKKMRYRKFKVQYEADAVALVKSKQPVDLSIPYDAAAKLAWEASGMSTPYPEFKEKYEAEAVELVKSKQS